MSTKFIFFLTMLSIFQGQAAEELNKIIKEEKEPLPPTGIVSSLSEEPEIPIDLPAWLQLTPQGENIPPKKGAPYTYKLDHHNQLPPHLLVKVISKGYDALDAIARGVIETFPHKLEHFSGDLEKFSEHRFKQASLLGYGTDYFLKSVYYSTQYTELLKEFNTSRIARLETFLCVMWALNDYAFKTNQGFTRGSFSIIDPESKLLNYLKNFASFSASTPQLPPSSPSDKSPEEPLIKDHAESVLYELLSDTPNNKGGDTSDLPPSSIEHTDLKDSLPPEDEKDKEESEKLPAPKDAIPLLSKEALTFSSDSDLDIKGKVKAIAQIDNLSPAIFNVMGSNFAYMRNGTSSHYVGLCDFQVGLDIRFEASGFTLPLLPFQMTHVLWGLGQTQLGYKKVFVKPEENGLGDNRSIVNHTLNFSASTKGIDENPLVRREKAIPASIASIAANFLMLVHETGLDMGRHTWFSIVMKKYISLSHPVGFFQESKNIDISRLYKLSQQINKNKKNPSNVRRLAALLMEEIGKKYDLKTIKYRTGNEIVIDIKDFIKK